MQKLSQIDKKNIKNITSSEVVKSDGIKLQTLKVEFVGIENETYQLVSAEYVLESEMTWQYTERIGEKFSGLGSDDGMRDDYKTVLQNEVSKRTDPSMRRFVKKVKKNGRIVTCYPSEFKMEDYL